MCPKAGRAPLYRKTCISACLLKGPAHIFQKPVLWNRCGNNYRDWPLIGMEISTRKNKIRSRYTERKNGPWEEKKCQGGDSPQAKWPSETKWMRVQVRLRLPSPLAPQEASDVLRLTPHCCCSGIHDVSQPHLSITGQEPAGSAGPRFGSQLATAPGNRGGPERKVWGFLLQATSMTLRAQVQLTCSSFSLCV